MPDSFSPELQQLVQEQLASGKYATADELLVEAVRLLADRDRRRENLRQELQVGRDQIDRGEGIDLEGDEALDRFLAEIEAEVNAEMAGKKTGQ